ncbi:MAG: patatin-like phospholipase family protein [Bacteroidota bacterium]
MIGAFSGGLGKVYGIQYLFLDPEYIGRVGFWSFFFVGLSFGNLSMAWHITCYILDSHRFRFIGVLERPFTKFCLNNSLVPTLAFLVYVVFIIRFQLDNEFAAKWEILLYLGGLLSGLVALQILIIFYFKFTNKDIFKLLAGSVDNRLRKAPLSRERVLNKLKENREDRYRVKSYLDLKLRVRSTDKIASFRNKEAVLRVFDQNHFNSVLIELIIITVILVLGFFMENPYLQIPAAASAMLVLSIIVMLVGAVSYWFRGWGLAFALAVFVLLNFGVKAGLGKGINQATGLHYDTLNAPYTISALNEVHSQEQFAHDYLQMQAILEQWAAKFDRPKQEKMVFICASGGGQRAALWAVSSLLATDKALDGKLMDQTVLMTGASGGLIGAAYYREMYSRYADLVLTDLETKMLENMGKDNLNPIIFSFLVHDLFFKMQTHEYAGRIYDTDRGYTFEQTLNRNLGYVFDQKISDYQFQEKQAEIPLLIMSPTIANDGRKLYISSLPVSFMARSSDSIPLPSQRIRGVDFQSLFKRNRPEDLSFLSALRMSASFPYITPNISLPTEPRIEIMDAGISDNFGVSDALRFIQVFKKWIAENTSGIVLLVIRDTKADAPIDSAPIPSVIDRITYPIASVYNNLTNMQDINNDLRAELMRSSLTTELDIVEIAYDSFQENEQKTEVERASLSWHLTTREKQNIIDNISIESNQQAIDRFKNLILSPSDTLR